MNRVVLDASAILALIHQERGYDKLTPEVLDGAIVSAVNLAEVQGKLVTSGWTSEEAWEDAMSPIQQILPFTAEHARMAGDLIVQTRTLGLSLADRACLALALEQKAPVYTADRSWNKLELIVRIHVIR